LQLRFPGIASKSSLLACAGALAALVTANPVSAATGGTAPGTPPAGDPAAPGTSPGGSPATVPGRRARLVNGRAIPPAGAPPAVVQVIRAANRIRNHPYKWGGGHGAWASSGYDCSGAVSYALHGGGFLDSPLDSRGLKRWGERGRGSWITVYTNRGHAYAVIAGLRWDTSGNRRGSGPRWHKSTRPATRSRYAVRHPGGY
jgi:cell wall-associated NlpC family hydrolase